MAPAEAGQSPAGYVCRLAGSTALIVGAGRKIAAQRRLALSEQETIGQGQAGGALALSEACLPVGALILGHGNPRITGLDQEYLERTVRLSK